MVYINEWYIYRFFIILQVGPHHAFKTLPKWHFIFITTKFPTAEYVLNGIFQINFNTSDFMELKHYISTLQLKHLQIKFH